MPAIKTNPVVGVDWLEVNVFGAWDQQSWHSLLDPCCGDQILHGQPVCLKDGGRHGPDFYPRSLRQESRFRIDVYHFRHPQHSVPHYAARVYLFSRLLNDRGPIEALRWIREYAARIGLDWESEQVSRLDLRADVTIPFDDFAERIDKRLWACRASSNEKLDGFSTSRYFGTRENGLLCIYDKVEEMRSRNLDVSEIAGPLTRVEFRLFRHWLRNHGIEGLGTVRLSELWRYLTGDWFRITDSRPDGKHYDRCPTWGTWEAIQQAECPYNRFLPRKGPK